MKLISLNVSEAVEISYMGRTFTTGIFKKPVTGSVMLRNWPRNLDGDGQGDLDSHGTEHKAVYAYSLEHYEYWKQELGRDDLAFGQFGENFTVQGMREEEVHIGDVFRFGKALVEVTQPRNPCYKLGMKMGMPDFQDRFIKSQNIGFYMRVLQEGKVWAGSDVERIRVGQGRLTVKAIHTLRFYRQRDVEGLKHALRIKELSHEWRRQLEDLLNNARNSL